MKKLMCSKTLSEWVISGTTPSLLGSAYQEPRENFCRGVATKFKVQLICLQQCIKIEQQTASLFHGPSLLAAAGNAR